MTSKGTRDTLARRMLRAVVIHARKHPGEYHSAIIGGREVQVWSGDHDSDYLSIDPSIQEMFDNKHAQHVRHIEQARTSRLCLGNKDDCRYWLSSARRDRPASIVRAA